MNWADKAKYLAKRAEDKGGIWLIWLNGEPQDDPAKLASTTDPEELRDPSHMALGWYEAGTTTDQIRADIARALGHEPSGEKELAGAGQGGPNPEGEPAAEDGVGYRAVPENHQRASAAEQRRRETTLTGEDPEPQPGPGTPQQSPQTEYTEEAAVADDEPSQGVGIPESVEHSIRAKLFNEYSKAHEKGPRGARDAWKRLIDLFESEVAG